MSEFVQFKSEGVWQYFLRDKQGQAAGLGIIVGRACCQSQHAACLTDQQPSPSDSVRMAAGSLASAFLGFDCPGAQESWESIFGITKFPGMKKWAGNGFPTYGKFAKRAKSTSSTMSILNRPIAVYKLPCKTVLQTAT